MKWYYPIGQWEYLLGAAFIAAYLLYIIRVVVAAQKLGLFASVMLAKFIVRTLYFALIIVAVLGPSFGEEKKEIRSLGKDIYIVMDLSRSMNATDLAPSRLAKAKFEIARLIDRFPGDRLGLIMFSTEAFVQCPLTFDQHAIRLFLDMLQTNMVSGGGTHTAAALQVALDKHTDTRNTTLKNTAKVILLVTDGEDFSENIRSVAREIADSGIRLFVLGIGSEIGSKIPVGRNHKRIASGQAVITRLDASSLQSLSRQAEGQYFEISPTRNDINRLIDQLSRVEGQLQDSHQLDISANKYYYFLLTALILITLDILIAVNTIQF